MRQVVSLAAARGGRLRALGSVIDEFLASPDFAGATVVGYGAHARGAAREPGVRTSTRPRWRGRSSHPARPPTGAPDLSSPPSAPRCEHRCGPGPARASATGACATPAGPVARSTVGPPARSPAGPSRSPGPRTPGTTPLKGGHDLAPQPPPPARSSTASTVTSGKPTSRSHIRVGSGSKRGSGGSTA